MSDKIKIECYECGLELNVNRSYWETVMDEYEKRKCPLCGEDGGLIV